MLITLYLLEWEFSILIFFAFSQSCSLTSSYSILLSTEKLSGTVKYSIKESIDGNWRSIKRKSIMDLIWTRPWRFDRHAHTYGNYPTVKHTGWTQCVPFLSMYVGSAYVDAPNLTFRHISYKVRVGNNAVARLFCQKQTRCAMTYTIVSYSLFPGNFAASDLRLAGDLSEHEYYTMHAILDESTTRELREIHEYYSSFFIIFIKILCNYYSYYIVIYCIFIKKYFKDPAL